MRILAEFLDKSAAALGVGPVKNALVIKKTAYPAAMVANVSGEVVGSLIVNTKSTESVATWSVTVRGAGRFGTQVDKEIPVDEMTFNSTTLGQPWLSAK